TATRRGGQGVGLVDEQPPTAGRVKLRRGLLRGVANVLTDQIPPGHLLEGAARQYSERLQQLAVDPGDGGLSGAWCPGEDQVVADRPHTQPLTAPPFKIGRAHV